ncbi:hypothetical protein GCM10023231_19610 [Olivibacter ginsenosidimutans]|uniref:Tetratricopeptide repeat protein n=1 Tax=Olivibacter ginsenosidimutans TaxID=1176537 RepID=A0ABP9B7Y9_9SPHI
MSTNRLDQLLNFLETTPDDPFILYAVASEYMKQKNFPKALDYFRELVGKRPDYVGTYYHYGKLQEQLGNEDEAIAIYRQGMHVATKANDLHALAELQAVYNAVLGIEPDDEEDEW